MIEVAHRQHGSPSFRPSSSSSPSSSRPAVDLAPLPIRHLKAPPSPLVNHFTSSSFSDNSESSTGGVETGQNGTSVPNGFGSSSVVEASGKGPAMVGKAGGKLTTLEMPGSSSPPHPLFQRIRKGQKLEDIHPVASELPPLQSIDSPFQLQEYLSVLIRLDTHSVEQIVALPQPTSESSRPFGEGFSVTNEKGKGKDSEGSMMSGMEEEPQTVDTDVWIYEQLRRIVLDFSTPWLTMLQKDCDKRKKPKTCEAMNADDWMYLCASHGEEKQCCAIDYIIHTLDGTTALLNSQRHFPSRTYIPTTSLRHFGSVSRRLSRIFVHAFEHHRDVFEACEADTSLYSRFIALVQTYDLIAIDSLPRLGSTRASNGAEETSVEKDEQQGKGEAEEEEEQDRLGMQPAVDYGSRDAGEMGRLFEAGEMGTREEEEEEGEEAEEEKVQDGGEGDGQGVNLERSGSAASRITVVPLAQSSETAKVDESSDQGEEQGKGLAEPEWQRDLQREQKGQEEVPQDVKDDEEED